MAPCLIALSSTARHVEEGTCLFSLSESLSQGCACGIVWLGCSELTHLYSNTVQELEQLSLFLADMERKYAVRASCLRCERPGGKKHMWSWEDAKYFCVNWYVSARRFEGRVFVKRGFFQVCCKRKHNPAEKNLQETSTHCRLMPSTLSCSSMAPPGPSPPSCLSFGHSRGASEPSDIEGFVLYQFVFILYCDLTFSIACIYIPGKIFIVFTCIYFPGTSID